MRLASYVSSASCGDWECVLMLLRCRAYWGLKDVLDLLGYLLSPSSKVGSLWRPQHVSASSY